MTAILSIDVGTTSLKGVLFDVLGNALAVEVEEYGLQKPAPDIVECDPDLYWEAGKKVVRNLLHKSRRKAQDIRSVGVTSQGETLIVVDAGGRVLRPAIVWLDNRSQAEAEEIGRHFDIRNNCWWEEMLQFLAISQEQLPELKYSGEFSCPISAEAARATGLSAETTVTTAPIDQIAGAIGAGNLKPGIVSETTGAALAICATCDQPTYDPAKKIPCHTHGARGKFSLLAWAPTGGMALRWFRDEFGGRAGYPELCAAARDIPPGAAGLLVLPYLSGAGCPEMRKRSPDMPRITPPQRTA